MQKSGCSIFASFFVISSRQQHSTCHLYSTILIFIMFTGRFTLFFLDFLIFLQLVLCFMIFLCFFDFFGFFLFFVVTFTVFEYVLFLDWVEWSHECIEWSGRITWYKIWWWKRPWKEVRSGITGWPVFWRITCWNWYAMFLASFYCWMICLWIYEYTYVIGHRFVCMCQ